MLREGVLSENVAYPMRARAVGGYEPDETEQVQLVELWHLSRTALAGGPNDKLLERFGSVHRARINWVVEEFVRSNAGQSHVAAKWVYCWAADNLGQTTLPGTISETYLDSPNPSRTSSPRARRR